MIKRFAFDKIGNKNSFKRVENKVKFETQIVDGQRKVKGYALLFDVLSGDRGGFLASIAKNSVVFPTYAVTLQYNHDSNWLLSSEANNSLKLTIDEIGVAIEATLGNTFIDDYVFEKIKDGVISGMSFGMYSIKSHREQRIITAADASGNPELLPLIGQSVAVEVEDEILFDEATITGLPAFPQTIIATFTKSKNQEKENIEIVEGKKAEVLVNESEADLAIGEIELIYLPLES